MSAIDNTAIPFPAFLANGGEAASAIRQHNWARTSLGPPEGWPAPLKTAISLLLQSDAPMRLYWGPLRLRFYNDAFSRQAGLFGHAEQGEPAKHDSDADWDVVRWHIDRSLGEEQTARAERNGRETGNPYAVSIVFDDEAPDGRGGVLVKSRALREADAPHPESARLATESAGMAIWELDPKTRIGPWSANRFDLLGLEPPADRRGSFQDWLNCIHPDDRAAAGEAALRCLEDGIPYRIEYRIVRPKDGVVRWLQSHGELVKSRGGKGRRFLGVSFDITEQKQSSLLLAQNEARLSFLDTVGKAAAEAHDAADILETTTRMLGEQLDVSICAYADLEADESTFVVRGDWRAPGSASLVGTYKLEDFGPVATDRLRRGEPLIVGDVSAELGPSAEGFLSAKIAATVCLPMVRGGRLRALMAVHSYTPRHWTEDEIELVRETAARSWAHVERARTNALLAERAERFRLAARATRDAIWDWDLVTNQVDWNEALAEVFGFAPTDIEQTADWWIGRIHPDDRQRISESVHAAIDGSDTNWGAEYRFLDANGNAVPILDRGYLIRDESGKAVRMIGAMLDQTERRRIEQVLRESNQRFRAAVDAVSGILWTNDASGRMVGEQDDWAALTGQEREEYEGYGWSTVVHPADRQATLDAWNEAVDRQEMFVHEHRLRTADGSYRLFSVRAIPTIETDGTVREWVGVHTDVTSQRENEEELRLRRARMEAVLRAARLGSWHWRIDTQDVEFNERWAEMLGYGLSEIEQSYETFKRLCHPEDLATFNKILTEHFEGHTDWFRVEIRMRHKQGHWVWVQTSGEVVERDQSGAPLVATGTHLDVTEQVETLLRLERHEKELAQQRAFLDAVIEVAPVGISIARDPMGLPSILNKEARRMTGQAPTSGGLDRYTAFHALGKDGGPLPVDEYPTVRALNDGREITGNEMTYRVGNELRRWIVNSKPLRDETGSIIAAVTAFIDIEEQRQAEELALLLNKELNHRVKNLFSVINALVLMSSRGETSVPEFAKKVRERISALAAAHVVSMGAERLEPVPLTTLLEAVLQPYERAGTEYRLQGPAILIPREAVTPIGLIIHELATNALKYGAWSAEGGKVSITWATEPHDEGERVMLTWDEETSFRLAEDRSETTRGFGSLLMEQSARQLGGAIEQQRKQYGLQTRFSFIVSSPERAT